MDKLIEENCLKVFLKHFSATAEINPVIEIKEKSKMSSLYNFTKNDSEESLTKDQRQGGNTSFQHGYCGIISKIIFYGL